MALRSKDMLGMKDTTPEEIIEILENAETLKNLLDTPMKKARMASRKSSRSKQKWFVRSMTSI